MPRIRLCCDEVETFWEVLGSLPHGLDGALLQGRASSMVGLWCFIDGLSRAYNLHGFLGHASGTESMFCTGMPQEIR